MHTRQIRILDMLERGKVEIHAAAQTLGVTEMTLRRDLRELERRKLCLIVKGGAVKHPARYEPDHPDIADYDRKSAIAKALYQRILPADSLFIGSGTTSLVFAKLIALRNAHPMTVITNSLLVASSLFKSVCRVILLGGELRSDSLDLVGASAEKNIAEYRVEWLVTGCDGAYSDYGFYTSDVNLSNLEKKSIGIADHVAVITESVKFGRRALTRFAPLPDIDLLVTDRGLSDSDRGKLRRAGIEVIFSE